MMFRTSFAALLVLLAYGYLHAFTDLGRWGETFEVKERFDVNKTMPEVLTQKNIYDTIERAQESSLYLPRCQENSDKTRNFTRVLDHDIEMKDFNISIKKGTTFNPLEHGVMNRYLIAIDGNDSLQIALGEHYKNQAVLIIYNGSISSIDRTINSKIYIADDGFQKAFDVRCLPTIFIQNGGEFSVKEIHIESLIQKKTKEK